MHITPRLLRTEAQRLPINARILSEKEVAREARILATAQCLMVRFSRSALGMAGLAAALGIAPATIRRHFLDVDSILAEILIRHLLAVCQAIGQVAADHPGRHAALRAAYLAATRTAGGEPAEAHLLLLRERHTLPPDLAEQVDSLRKDIGDALAGPNGPKVLSLLDNTELHAQEIASLLGASAHPCPALPAPRQAKPPYRNWKLSTRYKSARQQISPIPACNSP
jgi:AcrR family transcriptional regulator